MHTRTKTFGWPHAGITLVCVTFLFAFALTGHAAAAGCFAKPSSCGYPDATNTGVPAGTLLTPSSSRTLSTNGAVINGVEITGPVTVTADNVTIKNSRIVATKGGNGSYGLILNSGADNFTIEHSEIVGPAGESNGLESAVWNHYGNPGVVARSDYFHHCADCWEGPGVFENDYMVVDAGFSGAHYEDIYVCGAAVRVEHSTLLNLYHQTATVFGDTAGCGGNTFEVKNSLLAGGGYLVYPQANASSAVGTMNVSNNRFARCLNGSTYDSSSGGTYCNVRTGDTNGYYPYGGFYGVAAYFFGGTGNVWANNVWDDSGKPVCASGSEGCGTASPPPTEPPVEEPPVEEPPVEEEPGTEPPPVELPPLLEAILNLPDEILAEVPMVLDGTGSTGPTALTCSWSIHTPTLTDVLSGCLSTYTFADPGNSSIKLTVHTSLATDSVRRTVTVLPAPAAVGPSPTGTTGTVPVAGASPAAAAPVRAATPAAIPALDARDAWKAPARVRPGSRTRLVAKVTEAGATCTWAITRVGDPRRLTRRHGCDTSLRAPASGALSVRLTIHAADGAVSVTRRTIRVG